jgi:hypothetical protein
MRFIISKISVYPKTVDCLNCVRQLYHSHSFQQKTLKGRASIFVLYLTYRAILYTHHKTMHESYLMTNLQLSVHGIHYEYSLTCVHFALMRFHVIFYDLVGRMN